MCWCTSSHTGPFETATVPLNRQLRRAVTWCSNIGERVFMLVDIEHREDICFMRFKGRFVTGGDRAYLLGKVGEVKDAHCQKVMADFHGVPYIDSTGIGFIVSVFTSVTKDACGRFVLVGANHRVREVFDLTRLSTVIPMAADEESGIAALNAEAARAGSR
jgi:anti-sigma B factor antagonist